MVTREHDIKRVNAVLAAATTAVESFRQEFGDDPVLTQMFGGAVRDIAGMVYQASGLPPSLP